MKIEEIKILRGPNYWSVRRPELIQMNQRLQCALFPARHPAGEIQIIVFLRR